LPASPVATLPEAGAAAAFKEDPAKCRTGGNKAIFLKILFFS
jgi:hypothetical protein